MPKPNRVHVEVSDIAFRKLMAEQRRRTRLEGRGKSYPLWKIVQDLLNTLPDPEVGEAEEIRTESATYANR